MLGLGELIKGDVPVLLDFFTEWNEPQSGMKPVIRDVAAVLGDKAKVIKINAEVNKQLVKRLRVKSLPTLIIYKEGEMRWRCSGTKTANTLISKVQAYI